MEQIRIRPWPPGTWTRLGLMVGLVLAVQIIGAVVTAASVRGWYPLLAKPAWNPPDWVFGPVWTTLYFCIAWAGWRLWNRVAMTEESAWRHPAMAWFAAQLVLNLVWSILFFGMKRPDLALVDIAALLLAIGMTIRHAWPIDRFATWLLVPYSAWVGYASSLNAAIWWLNR